jgi:uncharacterized protein DUF4157/poly(A) polymerase-like protein
VRDFGSKRSSTSGRDEKAAAPGRGPGQRTLTGMLPPANTPVQRDADAATPVQRKVDEPRSQAAAGGAAASGPSAPPCSEMPAARGADAAPMLPRSIIRDLFGGGVQRKTAAAEPDAEQIHASARRGIDVAFATQPDLQLKDVDAAPAQPHGAQATAGGRHGLGGSGGGGARAGSAGGVRLEVTTARERVMPLSSGGRELPGSLRQRMEERLNADFSDVRVHIDGRAEALGARAFAQGSQLHFAAGEYDPGSAAGQVLIAHELTHVVQQRAGRVSGDGAVDDPALEAEADQARGAGGARSLPGGGGSVLQRKPVKAWVNQRVIVLDTDDPRFAASLAQALAGLTLVDKLNALAQLDSSIAGPNLGGGDQRASAAVAALRGEVETTELARLPMTELLALAQPRLPRGIRLAPGDGDSVVIGGKITVTVDDLRRLILGRGEDVRARVFQAFERKLNADAAPIAVDSDKVFRDAIKQGWLSEEEVEIGARKLGRDAFAELVHSLLEAKKQGQLRAAVEQLRQHTEVPRLLGDRSLILLGDAAQVGQRQHEHSDSMKKTLSGSSIPGCNRSTLDLLESRVGSRLFHALAEHALGASTEPLTLALQLLAELDDRQQRPAAIIRLHAALENHPPALPVTPPTKLSVPMEGQADQLDNIIAHHGATDVRVAQRTALTIKVVGGALIPIMGDDRTRPEYCEIVERLRAARLQGVNQSALFELADVFFCAADVVPLVATGDWGIIEGFGLLMGIPMDERKPHVPFSTFLRQKTGDTSFLVELCGSRRWRIRLCPIDSVRGPALPVESAVARLARSGRTLNPQVTLERGMMVLLPNRIGRPDSSGFFMGYDDAGRVRVAFPSLLLVETLPEDEPIDPATGGRRGPEPERAVHGWRRNQFNVHQLGEHPAFQALAEHAQQLKRLPKRKVGESEHTVSDYMGIIESRGFEAHIVGGATRDTLLGADPNDIDLASSLPASDLFQSITGDRRGMGKKNARLGQLETRRNLPFGTVQVDPMNETGLDIISSHDGTQHGRFSTSLELDALARDFTINALYYGHRNDQVIDPTGRGVQDVQDKVIRFIDPKAYVSDPVLIARWIKCMSKRGFTYQGPPELKELQEAFDRHSLTMEPATRARFINRLGCTPTEALERAEKLKLSVDAMKRILGLENAEVSVRAPAAGTE